MFNLSGRLALQKHRIIDNIAENGKLVVTGSKNELICVSKCKNATLTFDSKQQFISKLVVEKCDSCTIVVPECVKILTSMIEITNCTKCTIVLAGVEVKTLQCENSSRNVLQFDTSRNSYKDLNIIWSESAINNEIQLIKCDLCETVAGIAVENVTVLKNIPVDLKSLVESGGKNDDSKDAVNQFRSRIDGNGDVTTVILIREGAGYLTTAAEKQRADERKALLEKKVEEFVIKQISFSSPKSALQDKPKHPHDPSIIPPLPPVTANDAPVIGVPVSLEEQLKQKQQQLHNVETHVTTLSDVYKEIEEDKSAQRPKPIGKIFNEADKTEFFDRPEEVEQNAKLIANLIKQSKHLVIYTGAGVSTSAKIPDYRGPQGVWTLRDKGERAKGIDIEQAFPTYCHYAIQELAKRGIAKYIVSTNVDGLHRRSGVPAHLISELHGNCYREICKSCGKEYLRGFDTTKTVVNYKDHCTGRSCSCGAGLRDTIIHFGENLPIKELNLATKHADEADIALVLGTSMLVRPASELPAMCLKNKNAKLVIVNLQRTPFDNVGIKIHAKTDEFMHLVMKELGIESFDTSFDALKELNKK